MYSNKFQIVFDAEGVVHPRRWEDRNGYLPRIHRNVSRTSRGHHFAKLSYIKAAKL